MRIDPDRVLRAMRADRIPHGESGRWVVAPELITEARSIRIEQLRARGVQVGDPIPPGLYTYLWCEDQTELDERGEWKRHCVMNDTPRELQKHLEFVLRASGSVLVTGLGLGCVVRGLLENERVTSIDVVEREEDVLSLVGPAMPADDRLAIHQAEALHFVEAEDWRRWDCAWHDLWSDPGRGEEHLAVTHARLLGALRARADRQGAWAFPRKYRKIYGFL